MAKYRLGFVTNSSSSSFVISKHFLSPHQIEQIHNHLNYGDWDRWDISEDEDGNTLSGWTSMDNFSMFEFFSEIGINPVLADWDFN